MFPSNSLRENKCDGRPVFAPSGRRDSPFVEGFLFSSCQSWLLTLMLQAWEEIWHFPAYKGWMSYQTALSQDLFISPSILNLASRQEDLSGGTCVTGNSFLLQFLRERAPSWGVSHRFFTCVWNLSVCLLKFPLLSLWAPVENDKSCDGFCFCWVFFFSSSSFLTFNIQPKIPGLFRCLHISYFSTIC